MGPLPDRKSAMVQGCVKTQTPNLRAEFRLDFVDAEIKFTGSFCRKKAMRKQFCASFVQRIFTQPGSFASF